MEGYKKTIDDAIESGLGWVDGNTDASAHFRIGRDGSVSQYVNLFDVAWAQGIAATGWGKDNFVLSAAYSRGTARDAGMAPGRFYVVDADGCNQFNRSLVSIEAEQEPSRSASAVRGAANLIGNAGDM